VSHWRTGWTIGFSAIAACATGTPAGAPSRGPAPIPGAFAKPVSFSILEDYDKGEDLRDVARDFVLFRALGIRTWRGSFGWDDYEPERGRYDFGWLTQFAALAARDGIALRPYIGYTPEWAASGRRGDGQTWNDPPARLDDWARFVDTLARTLRRYPNVRSYEIYNEEDTRLWWDGSRAEYDSVLARGAAAVRRAAPGVQVLLGGMVWPDVPWVSAACAATASSGGVSIVPIHAYPETWTPESVTVENYLGPGYAEGFLPPTREACGARPVWINETGYATTPGRSERQQANWWARAIATFLAAPGVEHIGVYEIKDERPGTNVIGDAPNLYLGLAYPDRRLKLAFHTVQLLVRLLGGDTLVVADSGVRMRVTARRAGALYHHLFVRRDGRQILVVWDRTAAPTLELALLRPGRHARSYALDGAGQAVAAFDGRTLRDVRLEPGEVRIFEISP
jgi:hypothetical protein